MFRHLQWLSNNPVFLFFWRSEVKVRHKKPFLHCGKIVRKKIQHALKLSCRALPRHPSLPAPPSANRMPPGRGGGGRGSDKLTFMASTYRTYSRRTGRKSWLMASLCSSSARQQVSTQPATPSRGRRSSSSDSAQLEYTVPYSRTSVRYSAVAKDDVIMRILIIMKQQ